MFCIPADSTFHSGKVFHSRISCAWRVVNGVNSHTQTLKCAGVSEVKVALVIGACKVTHAPKVVSVCVHLSTRAARRRRKNRRERERDLWNAVL